MGKVHVRDAIYIMRSVGIDVWQRSDNSRIFVDWPYTVVCEVIVNKLSVTLSSTYIFHSGAQALSNVLGTSLFSLLNDCVKNNIFKPNPIALLCYNLYIRFTQCSYSHIMISALDMPPSSDSFSRWPHVYIYPAGMTYLSYFMNKDGPGYKSTLDWVRRELPDERINNFTVWRHQLRYPDDCAVLLFWISQFLLASTFHFACPVARH